MKNSLETVGVRYTVSPVVMVHDRDEKRRFEAMFDTTFEADHAVSKN